MLFNSRPIGPLAPGLATIQSGPPVDYRAQSRSTTRTWIFYRSDCTDHVTTAQDTTIDFSDTAASGLAATFACGSFPERGR